MFFFLCVAAVFTELITMYTGQMQTLMEIKHKLSYSNAVLHRVLKRLDVIEKGGQVRAADPPAELPFRLPLQSLEEVHEVDGQLKEDMALQA